MDGLSAAASIIGVISLAMQLGQTTRKLIGFLDTAIDAPNEVVRLNDLLKLIFAVSAGVVNALEHQRRHQGDEAFGREHICEVLILCLRKLTSIQDIVDRSERLHSGGSRTARGWAKLKLALKKDEILELERQLGQALSVLNVLFTTSVMHDNLSRAATSTSPIIGGQSILASKVHSEEHECHSGTNMNSTLDLDVNRAGDFSIRPKITTTLSQLHICLGGPLSLRCEKRTRGHLALDPLTDETRNEVRKKTVEISLRFLSTSIHLVISRLSSCSPSLGLRVQHVVSSSTWYRQIFRVLEKDDVEGFQKLIGKGLCTLDSCTEGGCTMLEAAEQIGAPSLAIYLHSQGCELSTTSTWLTLSHSVDPGCMRRLPQSRFRSVSQKLDLVEYDPEDIIPHPQNHGMIKESLLLEAFEWFASTGSLETSLPFSDYLGSILCLVCAWWGRLEADCSRDQLSRLIYTLISRGGDVHYLDRLGRTPLRALLSHMLPEHDSSIVTHWLSLLGDAQIDVRKYLEEECRICPSPFETVWQTLHADGRVYLSFRPRMVTMSILEDNQIGPFDAKMMWVDPSGNAVELLQEFKVLPEVCVRPGTTCNYITCWIDLWRRESASVPADGRTISELLNQWTAEQDAAAEVDCTQSSIAYWENEVQPALEAGELNRAASFFIAQDLCSCDMSGQYLELWPFNGNTHTMCQSGNNIGQACLDQSTWCPMHCCRFNHERFERKQKKKWMKRMGIKTIKVPRVPGGWVE